MRDINSLLIVLIIFGLSVLISWKLFAIISFVFMVMGLEDIRIAINNASEKKQ